MTNDPEYRALILPAGNYAVVDRDNNVLRKFNNQDDAISYAREKCGPKEYSVYSVVDADGRNACVVRASTPLRAQMIARRVGIEGEPKDLSQYYRNMKREILPHLGSSEGVLAVDNFTKEDGKEGIKFVIR